ncbi:unnamed protein product [Boreogadus saida]
MRFLSLLPLDDDAESTQIRSASTTRVVLAQCEVQILVEEKRCEKPQLEEVEEEEEVEVEEVEGVEEVEEEEEVEVEEVEG